MRRSRWWDVPAVLLLAVALLTAGGRLVATEWVDELAIVHTFVFLGLAAGLALGLSLFSPGVAGIFALLYGLFVVPWELGRTVGQISQDALWSDRLVVLANRLVHTVNQFAQQEPVYDPILFLFTMAVLAWALSVHAGYTLTRRASPWRVILPPGLAALLIHVSDPYRPRGIWYLAAYFLFSLLLVARLTFLQLRRRWVEDETRIPPLVGLDLSFSIAAVVVVVIFLAWTVPAMADVFPAARRIWDRATSPLEARTEKLFASLRRQGATITASDYYGDDFSLGRGRELSDALVASVQASVAPSPVRYYWRARVYDRYGDGKWSTGALTSTQRVDARVGEFEFPELEGRRTMTFTFTSSEPMVTLYVAPQPRWISRRVEVDLAQNPDGTADIASIHATPPMEAGGTYRVRSSVADMTISELREAGTDYPQWIMDRYLELPEGVTVRTRELAEQIAEDQDTAYDVVAAVTRYLRNNIRYTETITDTIAADQEPLDWFLFDGQVGFCNYYASSEVILLRAVGVPARLAVGFAEGEHQSGTNTFLVYERNAHAWPEVYFPGFGWVEFEPTVSQDPIRRPLGEIETEDEGRLRVPTGGDTEDRWRERLADLEGLDEIGPGGAVPTPSASPWERARELIWVAAVLVGLILIVLIWRTQKRARKLPPFPVLLEIGVRRIGWNPPAVLRRWAQRARLSPLERAYGEITRALTRLGAPPSPADTAAERAVSLTGFLPLGAGQTHALLAQYEAAIYSPHRIVGDDAQDAARTIRRLSWRLKLQRLLPWD